MTLMEKIKREKEWKPPDTGDMPSVLGADDLRILGTHRGRKWWSHSIGELVEGTRLIDPAVDVLPGGGSAVVKAHTPDGELRYRTFRIERPGSFKTLTGPAPTAKPKATPPSRPVDLFAYTFGASRTWAITATPSPPTLGVDEVVRRIRRNGTDVYPAAKGDALTITAPAGRPTPGVVELAERFARLLAPHLRGEPPLPCEVTDHGAPAQTIAAGGALWCGDCSPEPKR